MACLVHSFFHSGERGREKRSILPGIIAAKGGAPTAVAGPLSPAGAAVGAAEITGAIPRPAGFAVPTGWTLLTTRCGTTTVEGGDGD